MKPFLFVVFAAAAVSAGPSMQMAVWQGRNHAEVARLTTPEAQSALLRDRAALAGLFAQVKPAGQIDPMVAIRLHALTQYATSPAAKPGVRESYAAALLDAAKAARDADTQSMFFEQLRWCALPAQAGAILAAALPGAAGMAALAAASARGEGVGAACLALSPEATIAPAEARKALAGAKDDEARIRALDLLGRAGDPSDADAVARYVGHANPEVSEAALRALEAFSPAAVSSRLPLFLSGATPANERPLAGALRRQPTDRLAKGLIAPFASFSPTGKKIALELMGQRRIPGSVPIAFSALSDADAAVRTGAYRVLREMAGPNEAPAVVASAENLPDGRVREEAVAALSAIARRDGGMTEALFNTAIRTGESRRMDLALAAAPRIGGRRMLASVAHAAMQPGETGENAARALAAWPEADAYGALFRTAVSSPVSKARKLAFAGLQRKITDQNKAELAGIWLPIRAQQPDAEQRKEIDGLFGGEFNVARGRPVTANVPHEAAHVAARLTDGTNAPWFGHGLPAVATVDFGAVEPVHAAKLLFWHDGPPRTYTFRLELSADGKTWKKAGGNEQAPKPATAEGVRLDFAETPARFARLTVLGNTANPNAHVHELEVYRRFPE